MTIQTDGIIEAARQDIEALNAIIDGLRSELEQVKKDEAAALRIAQAQVADFKRIKDAANARTERAIEGLRHIAELLKDFGTCGSKDPATCKYASNEADYRYVEGIVSDLLRELDAEEGK